MEVMPPHLTDRPRRLSIIANLHEFVLSIVEYKAFSVREEAGQFLRTRSVPSRPPEATIIWRGKSSARVLSSFRKQPTNVVDTTPTWTSSYSDTAEQAQPVTCRTTDRQDHWLVPSRFYLTSLILVDVCWKNRDQSCCDSRGVVQIDG